MKTEALNPFGVEPSGDGQELGHPRHVPVKGGIKAGHLRQFRMPPTEHAYELNARRHVFGVVRTDPAQLGHQLRGDALGLLQLDPAVDHAMPDPDHFGERGVMIEPANQKLPCGAVIGCANDTGGGLSGAVTDGQDGIGQADALDLAGQQPHGWRVRPVEGELDARRPAVDGQDAANRLPVRLATGRSVSDNQRSSFQLQFIDGADGGGRTHTLSRVPDFESSASANSATSASLITKHLQQLLDLHFSICIP